MPGSRFSTTARAVIIILSRKFTTGYEEKIRGEKGNIKIFVNGELKIDYTDLNPLYFGSIAFETLDNSRVYFDEVEVKGPSGVNKSYDAGSTWVPRNEGIKARAGPSLDGIPNFALTIDSNDPDIIWAGMQFARGVYKSTDGGETWFQVNNGIPNEGGNWFCGFLEMHPKNPEILYAACGNNTRGKGGVFKTENGGQNWQKVLGCRCQTSTFYYVFSNSFYCNRIGFIPFWND